MTDMVTLDGREVQIYPLVWSLSGVVTVWCGHCLVCSEASHFTPSAPTSNQAPVL